MSIPTVGNIRVVVSVANAAGVVFQNVLHAGYDSLTTGLESDLLDLVAQWVEDTFDTYWELCSQTYSGLDTQVYLYNTGSGLFDPVGSVANSHNFTGIGDPLPNQVAGLCGLVTTNPRVRGRVYLPPVVETENGSDGNPGAVTLARIALVGAALATPQAYAQGNITGLVFSRKLLLFADVVSVIVSGYWATQRRRRPGVGI